MKKISYCAVLIFLVTTASTPVFSETNTKEQSVPQKPETQKSPPPKPVPVKKVQLKDFQNLELRMKRFEKLSEQKKRSILLLQEARENYAIAEENFRYVIEVKNLVSNIQQNENCYITYYRLQDIDKNIRQIPKNEDLKILEEMKAPLNEFLKKCGTLRLDLLKKHEENLQ